MSAHSFKTAVCTWFVSDSSSEATYFPQLGLQSDAPEAKAIYWRCVCMFFTSLLASNPGESRVFFTNSDLPRIDGYDVANILADLGVEVVRLPISYRIKRDYITSWGNQFYILDIIKHISKHPQFDRYAVFDSDCLVTRDITPMLRAIDTYGFLTYVVGRDEKSESDMINGCDSAGMGSFLRRGNPDHDGEVTYCGGEILAATTREITRLAAQIDVFWKIVEEHEDAEIREEGHFLSVLYALNGYELATANPFIKRMWTTFKYRNTCPEDVHKAIWHLPAEKRTGFKQLFDETMRARRYGSNSIPEMLKIHSLTNYKRAMGIPARDTRKFTRDLALKLKEKYLVLASGG